MLATVPRGVAFGSWSRSFRRSGARSTRRFPGSSRHPAPRARPARDGAGLAGRGAARGAVPVRGRDARLPLARRPRPPPGRLPRGGGRPPAADRGGHADVRHEGRAARRWARRPPPACATWRTASSSARRPKAALKTIRHLWENGAAVSLDLLGEATVTQAEADRYAARCMDALETLAEAAPLVAGAPGARGGLARPAPAREPVREGVRADAAAAARGARGGPRGRGPPDAAAARAREGAGRPPAHRHGVGGHDRGHARARVRAARRAGAARRPVGGGRDPGLPARVAASSSSRCSTGRRRPRASSRSWSAS